MKLHNIVLCGCFVVMTNIYIYIYIYLFYKVLTQMSTLGTSTLTLHFIGRVDGPLTLGFPQQNAI